MSWFIHAAHAIEFDPTGTLATNSGLGTEDPVNTTLDVIGIVLSVLGVIALILVIIGGFMWLTSGGNEEKIKKAKRLLISATIGLALIFSAYGISAYVFEALVNATAGS